MGGSSFSDRNRKLRTFCRAETRACVLCVDRALLENKLVNQICLCFENGTIEGEFYGPECSNKFYPESVSRETYEYLLSGTFKGRRVLWTPRR